jgi:hypothetical protein
VAVRHYFGHFEEGEEGHVPETAEAEDTESGEGISVENAMEHEPGHAEVEVAPAVIGDAEAESENAAEVLEEAESVVAAEAETDEAAGAEAGGEGLDAEEAEDDNVTAAELAVESVPVPDDVEPLDTELDERASEIEDEQAAKEDGA